MSESLEKHKHYWQDENNKQIGQWDNVKHHSQVSSFPDHYHDHTNQPFPSEPANLEKVIALIEQQLIDNL